MSAGLGAMLGIYAGVAVLVVLAASYAWLFARDHYGPIRRNTARTLLLCWVWPVLLVVVIYRGIGELWQAADWGNNE